MTKSHKKSRGASFVAIPLGPVGSDQARREKTRARRPRSTAVDLVLRLRFTIALEVEDAEDEAAI
jgi:hypothetical protein